MATPETYSLAQIGEFMLAEQPALHGVSPEVYAQNRLIQRLAAVGSEQEAPAILGCQIVGSRAHGYAEPGSDLDIAIIGYRGSVFKVNEFGRRLRSALLPAGIEVDWMMAPSLRGIQSPVTQLPDEFIRRIQGEPRHAVGYYEVGAYDTPDLRLGALAATEVIRGSKNPHADWATLQHQHVVTYLGDRDRVAVKLGPRLGIKWSEVGKVLTHEFWGERIRKFGLPFLLDQRIAQEEEWLASGAADGAQQRSIDLYEQVKSQMRR